MLAGNLIDMIPNSGMTPLTWLIVGALFGRLELGRIVETAAESTNTPARSTGYTQARPVSSGLLPGAAATASYTRQTTTHFRPARRDTT
jgi:hypothetical protein